ncbi:hypothetical protein EYF80_059943 [Liparis tanakae]|uniref:Uncharacterized protein n=1 Tax=Liparis tanakae TaxID=230148 RepID=A0A4Z2ELS3_9TELE|nr:hypothetical protein EYF80_059943 [Liparis tanakae]
MTSIRARRCKQMMDRNLIGRIQQAHLGNNCDCFSRSKGELQFVSMFSALHPPYDPGSEEEKLVRVRGEREQLIPHSRSTGEARSSAAEPAGSHTQIPPDGKTHFEFKV